MTEERCEFTDLYPSACAHCRNTPNDFDIQAALNSTEDEA